MPPRNRGKVAIGIVRLAAWNAGQYEKASIGRHLLIEQTWLKGSKWFFRWNGVETGSKCIETWGDGDLYHCNIEYNEGVTHAVNGLGVKTSYYRRNGLVYNEIDGNGESWTKQFNRFNELEIERDPLGNETVYYHDDFGNVTTIIDPAGGFESREYYDPQFPHSLMGAMDTNGGKCKFSYDEQGNLVKRINPKGAVLKIEYKEGLPPKIHGETSGMTLVAFDHDYNLVEVVEPLGATWKYSHNALGRCTLETNPNRLRRELTFDLLGRVTKVHDGACPELVEGMTTASIWTEPALSLPKGRHRQHPPLPRRAEGCEIHLSWPLENDEPHRGGPHDLFQLRFRGAVARNRERKGPALLLCPRQQPYLSGQSAMFSAKSASTASLVSDTLRRLLSKPYSSPPKQKATPNIPHS